MLARQNIRKLETEEIIYLVAFALMLRILVRFIFRYRKEGKKHRESN